MSTIKIPGAWRSDRDDEPFLRSRVLKLERKATLRIEASRSDTQAVDQEIADDDVLEIELENGLRIWTSYGQYREDVERAQKEGEIDASRDGELSLYYPLRKAGASRDRGVFGFAIKVLRVLGIADPVDRAASFTAGKLAEKIESQLDPGPGLYRWRGGRLDRNDLVETKDLEGGLPSLVFLHGTASSTLGSFGALAETADGAYWERLRQRYGDRIFGFEHHTMTRSPIDNAVGLLEMLPKEADLHLVSHSRGGLVGELLCHGRVVGLQRKGPFGADELERFAAGSQVADLGDDRNLDKAAMEHLAKLLSAQRENDRAGLRKLSKLLAEKRPAVKRFVRVACPANGTTLASKRLDLYLSGLVNVIGLIPGFRANPVFEMLSDLLLAVAKKRTQPEELPGIEAMMPTSPLIHLLNSSGLELEADLSVISGDIEGSGVLGNLKVFLTDLFYLADHDLVVNTASMSQGALRSTPVREYFTSGPDVSHFRYFKNEDTVQRLVAGLERADDEASGFVRVRGDVEVEPRRHGERDGEKKPVVIVVPGIMGSRLAARGNVIWMDLSDLAKGRMGRLTIDAPNVHATGLLGRAYGDLVEYLSASHVVIPFPYDWRRSLLEAGDKLGDTVQEALSSTDKPVRILAHSMGGLVSRAMMVCRPEVWNSVVERDGGRLIMMGTPNRGSMVVPHSLLGREKMVRMLGMLDLAHNRREVVEIIAGFTGFLEMLPQDDDGLDFFSADSWKQLIEIFPKGSAAPTKKALAEALATRKQLAPTPTRRDRVVYVAGHAPETPERLEIDDSRKKKHIRIWGSNRGDGRVPWSTGIPEGVRTWYMNAVHGKLCAHAPAFGAIQDLLETGETTQLSLTPPVAVGESQTFVVSDLSRGEEPLLFPSQEELEGAVLGYQPGPEPLDELPELQVEVTHGDLAGARGPVLVGHYEGDAIVSAEWALDNQLDGRLSARHRLGLYPGAIGTHNILFDDRRGAVVVGLGEVGGLGPGSLVLTVEKAVIQFAILAGESRPDEPFLTLSSLAVGSGEGGIGADRAVLSLLRGVAQANRRLQLEAPANQDGEGNDGDDQPRTAPPLIGRLEIVELYKDRAMQALHALQRIAARRELGASGPRLRVASRLREIPGGRKRVVFTEPGGWWQRLIIEADKKKQEDKDEIRFVVLADRARSEDMQVRIQQPLVDQLIETAIRQSGPVDATSSALFELLVANYVKHGASEQRDLLLVLDQGAARYPWEMLVDRFDPSAGSSPVSVSAGLIRQLRVPPSPVSYATGNRALVVGDPPSDLPELPGAQREARLVGDELLRSGWSCAQQIRTAPDVTGPSKVDAASVVRALFAHDYRVLHLAGHGVFDRKDNDRTGMVIGGDAPERRTLLRPAEVHQMRLCPELVFLNCCHLGNADESDHLVDRHDLAANLASQFIRNGVKAIVAAGWAVDDRAALTFSRVFYEYILDGAPFGDTIREARRRTHEEHGYTNTWGAYQCYGDPGFRLKTRGGARRSALRSAEGPRFVDADEVIAEVANLKAQAKVRDSAGKRRWLEGRIDGLWKEVSETWGHDAAVVAGFAEAYGEIGLFDSAAEKYRLARELDSSKLSLGQLEQDANMRVRSAADVAGKAPRNKNGELFRNDYDRAKDAIEAAAADLERLNELAESGERWSLIGGSFKRLAKIAPASKRRAALLSMTEAYEQAAMLDPSNPYPLLNALTGTLTLDGPSARPGGAAARVPYAKSKDFEAALEHAEKRAEILAGAPRDFWQAVHRIDARVLRALYEGKLSKQSRSIRDDYRDLVRRLGSGRELDSVVTQHRFLATMLKRGKRGGQVEALEQLAQSLED